MTSLLQGVWPACPTILTGDEQLDREGMRRVVRFLADAGVDGLWLLGGGGEGVTLTDEARRQAIEVAVDEVGDTLPILVGVTAEGTRRALARYDALADLPVDGIFATPPYYYATDERETTAFYRALVEETGRPVVVYNNPHIANAAIGPALAARLAEIPGIAGIKDSSGDLLVTQSLVRAVRGFPAFAVAQGYDQLAAASLLAGAHGVVTATGCFAPKLFVELVRAVRARELELAFAAQIEILDLLERLAWDPYSDSAFIRGAKTCLEVLGLGRSAVTHPFAGPSDEERAHVARALERVRDLARGTPDAS